MNRDLKNWALWNKMGFPGPGSGVVVDNLKKFKAQKNIPLFINIGKNRSTDNQRAHEDYIRCLQELHSFADAFVVNISSPNTKSLRDLQSAEVLQNFLEPIISEKERLCPQVPLLLKMSPEMDDVALESLLSVSAPLVDGWILTNTTNHRSSHSPFPPAGGVSGGPLTLRSRETLKKTIQILGERRGDKLIVSVGGILDSKEAQVRLDLGANLVQAYSGQVFHGPKFFQSLLSSN